MEKHVVVTAIGAVLAIAGGIPAAVTGVSNPALFILFAVMLFTGLGLIAYGKKLRDRR